MSWCNECQYSCCCFILLLFHFFPVHNLSSLFTVEKWCSTTMTHLQWLFFFLWRLENGGLGGTDEELDIPTLSFLFLHLQHILFCLHRLGRWGFSTKSVAPVSSQMLPALQSATGRRGREQMRPDDLAALMVCDCQPHWGDLYCKTDFSLLSHLHINNSFPWNNIFCF